MVDEDLRRIESAYLESGGEFLVGETADEVVAVGGFVPAGDGAVEIKRMRVDPDHQHNGYGAAVLAALEDAARREGYERAVLETHELLAAAQALYESRGCREAGCEVGRDGYDRVRDEKSL